MKFQTVKPLTWAMLSASLLGASTGFAQSHTALVVGANEVITPGPKAVDAVRITSKNEYFQIRNAGKIQALGAGQQHGISVNGLISVVNQIDNAQGASIAGHVDGIYVGNQAHADRLQNAGQITGGRYALFASNRAIVDTLTNRGTMQGQQAAVNVDRSAYVKRLENAGHVTSADTAIRVVDKGQLGQVSNTGAIEGQRYGLYVGSSGQLETFTNRGTLTGQRAALLIEKNGHLQNLDNQGVIHAAEDAIYVGGQGQLDRLHIAKGARVVGGDVAVGQDNFGYADAGIRVDGGRLQTLENEGEIAGAMGVVLQNGQVGQFKNTGTIRTTGQNPFTSAVYLIRWHGHSGIENFENTGMIKSDHGYAFLLEGDTRIQNFTNVGWIQADKEALATVRSNQSDGARIDHITLKKGSMLMAAGNTIALWNQNQKKDLMTVGQLNVEAGAKLTSWSANTIYTASHSGIESVHLNGTVYAGQNGLLNEGTLGTSDSGEAPLVVGPSAKIEAKGGWALVNAGTIHGNVALAGDLQGRDGTFKNTGLVTGGVVFTGEHPITLLNTGDIKGGITQNGKGEIVVKDWFIHTGDVTSGSQGLYITGQGPGNVKVEHVTFHRAAEVAAMATKATPQSVRGLVSYNGQALAPQSVGLSEELTQLGFTSAYDQRAQTLATGLTTEVTAGGLLTRATTHQLMRRDFFVSAAIDEATQTATYHARQGTAHSGVFVKPYGSVDSGHVREADLSGNTYGVLAGAHGQTAQMNATLYAGYEQGDLSSQYMGSHLDLTSQSVYVGADGQRTVAAVGAGELFIRAGARFNYTANDVMRNLTDSASKSDTHAYSFQANAQVGLNYPVNDRTLLTPTVGLGFMTTSLSDLALHNKMGQTDRYQVDRLQVPYADVGLSWQQGWSDTIRTQLAVGVRSLLTKHFSMTSQFDNTAVTDTIDLPSHYEYASANVAWLLDKNNEVTLGYTGVFDAHGQSHNLTAKYEYLF